jgi:hypothetical protein
LLLRAKTGQLTNDCPKYWLGYIQGLRRAYYGDRYGSLQLHRDRMARRGDAESEEMSHGYRSGFAGRGPDESLRPRRSITPVEA